MEHEIDREIRDWEKTMEQIQSKQSYTYTCKQIQSNTIIYMHRQTNIYIYKHILSNTVIYIHMQANTIQIHSYISTYTQIRTYTIRYKLNIQDHADPIGAGAVGPFAENV